jgi:hypothetical protein
MSNLLIPGLSDDQALAVSMALEIATPDAHDGISLAINSGLGNTGGPYSNAMVMAAITIALIRCSGMEIPSTLFPGANLTADTTQRLAASATPTAVGSGGANANLIQSAKSGMNGGGGLKAN